MNTYQLFNNKDKSCTKSEFNKQSNIKDMLKTIDFYKSDTSRVFSINLLNIINFQKDLMIKISSICNELNLSIDSHHSSIIFILIPSI